MKKLLFTICAAMLSTGVYAQDGFGRGEIKRQRAIQTARQLVFDLREISYQAQLVASRASWNGRYHRAQKFRNLNYNAQELIWTFRRLVLRPLRMGAPLRRVGHNLQGVRYEFRQFNQSVYAIFVMPPRMQRNIAEVRQSRQRLRRILTQIGPGPGPVPRPGPGPRPRVH